MEENLEYFEDEVRDGFYIPAMIKKCWKAQLIVLEDVVNVCKKHNIKYFAAWGTLLGAVRHKGYIPWDDDLDICMMRKDYEKFCEVALKDLPENYSIKNFKTDDTHFLFLSRVISSKNFRFDEEYLRKYCGLPYIFGVDIFIVDYLDRDEKVEKEKQEKVKNIISIADGFHLGNIDEKTGKGFVETLEKAYNVKFDRNRSMAPQVYMLAEKLLGETKENQADNIRQQVPALLHENNSGYFYPKNYLEDVRTVSFEDSEIDVPAWCADVLRKKYGRFMTPIKEYNNHGYPFFKKQHKEIEETLKFSVPSFLVPVYKCPEMKDIVGSSEYDEKKYNASTYKSSIKEWLEALKEATAFVVAGNKEELLNNREIFEACQTLAINIGQTIDEMKGDGHKTVSHLEEYCERVFLTYNVLAENEDSLEEAKTKLKEIFETVEASVTKEILDKKEIVFLPFKDDYWESLEKAYSAAILEDADVYVMPIAYYYRTFEGNLINPQYKVDKYPESLNLVHFEAFDLEKHHPDKIYIQNPYDDYNVSISVHPNYYSSKLKDFCDNLIYIPYFKTCEFSKENGRDYANMEFYCNMPGVMNSDAVVVQSEKIKACYLQKLTEFAGDKSSYIWENKILTKDEFYLGNEMDVDETAEIEVNKVTKFNANADENAASEKNITGKKRILYCLNTNLYFDDPEAFVCKIKEEVDIFFENREHIEVIAVIDDVLKNQLALENNGILKKIEDIFDNEKTLEVCKLVSTDEEILKAVSGCDAYYGDDCIFARNVMDCGKPVMVKNSLLLNRS